MLYMNARAEEPICHSLCPNSLGHHALGREGSTIVHIMHRCEPGPCTDVEWLTGWLAATGTHNTAWKCVGSACHTQSRNLPKIHPGINRAAMPRDWQQRAATSCSGLSDVIPPGDGISPPETQWDKSVNEGLISMDRSRELLYHLQYPVL